MAFTGNEDHFISLETASQWTANFRATILPGEKIAEVFGKKYIQDILDQPDCVGIRIYNSIDDAGAKHLIICGVKTNEDDLYTGKLAENSLLVPPFGGANNPLNS